MEKTSSNIVVNLEKFANAIVPPPPKASHEPARKGADCVCACAACACACACVSLCLCMCRWRRTLNEFSEKNWYINRRFPLDATVTVEKTSMQACRCSCAVEAGGKGVMVINANTVLHLNQTATAFAYYFMQGLPEKDVLAKIRRMYRVNAETSKSGLRETRLHHQHLGADRKNRPRHFPGNRKRRTLHLPVFSAATHGYGFDFPMPKRLRPLLCRRTTRNPRIVNGAMEKSHRQTQRNRRFHLNLHRRRTHTSARTCLNCYCMLKTKAWLQD